MRIILVAYSIFRGTLHHLDKSVDVPRPMPRTPSQHRAVAAPYGIHATGTTFTAQIWIGNSLYIFLTYQTFTKITPMWGIHPVTRNHRFISQMKNVFFLLKQWSFTWKSSALRSQTFKELYPYNFEYFVLGLYRIRFLKTF